MVHIRQKNYKISMSVAVALSMAFEKNFGLFSFFLRSLIPKYTKVMYVSSISLLPKTKQKFPFRYIVKYENIQIVRILEARAKMSVLECRLT